MNVTRTSEPRPIESDSWARVPVPSHGMSMRLTSCSRCGGALRVYIPQGSPLGLWNCTLCDGEGAPVKPLPTTVWPEYGPWSAMRQRCCNPRACGFENYGGRGITVCARWDSFENFLADMGPRPSREHSLDRIDVNGNYEPGNVRWATHVEQANNKRRNRRISAFGRQQTLTEWAREFGLTPACLGTRLRGWKCSVEEALTAPPNCQDYRGDAQHFVTAAVQRKVAPK